MKIRQLFCIHKEKHLVGYDTICDVFTHTVYEKRNVYECNKCGKRFYQIQGLRVKVRKYENHT